MESDLHWKGAPVYWARGLSVHGRLSQDELPPDLCTLE